MFDGFESRLSLKSLLGSFYLSWFMLITILGFASLAYYTNPSERSFRRFLTQLSLQGHFSQLPPKSCSSKRSNVRHSAGRAQLSSMAGKICLNLRTPPYTRHNLFICTLVSADHYSSHSTAPLSEEDGREEGISQADWYLGCFSTWWTLHRPGLRSWFLNILPNNLWAPNWQGWLVPGLVLPMPPTSARLANLADQSITKSKKKRKQNQNQNQKTLTLLTSSSIRGRAMSDCRSLEKAAEPALGSMSSVCEYSSFSNEVKPFHQDIKTGRHTKAAVSVSESTAYPTKTPMTDETRIPLSSSPCLVARTGEISIPSKSHRVSPLARMPLRDNKVTHHLASSSLSLATDTTLSQSSCARNLSRTSFLHDTSREPSESSDSPQQSNSPDTSQPQVSSNELEIHLQEIKFKKNEEDLNKTHYKSSLKHLNEIKDLKEFKLLNLDEKLEQFRLTHSKLAKKSAQFQEDLQALNSKRSTILTNFPKHVEQIKREEDRVKSELRKSELEFEQLSKAYEMKKAHQTDLQEMLTMRKLELSLKREACRKRSKSKSNPNSVEPLRPGHAPNTCDEASSSPTTSAQASSFDLGEESLSVVSESDTAHNRPAASEPAFGATSESELLTRDHSANPHPVQPVTNISGSSPRTLATSDRLLADPTSFSLDPPFGSSQVLVDSWSPDPWAAEVPVNDPNDIRATFTSLPNLEAHVLKEQYALTALMGASDLILANNMSHHAHSRSLAKDLFRHCFDLDPQASAFNAEPDHPSVQFISPYGAIGRQATAPRSLPHSPLTHASPIPFHQHSGSNSSLIDQCATVNGSAVPFICNGLPTRSELFPDLGIASLSRQSSSTSLSQHSPAFSSSVNPSHVSIGPYAPSRFQKLEEVDETCDLTSSPQSMPALMETCEVDSNAPTQSSPIDGSANPTSNAHSSPLGSKLTLKSGDLMPSGELSRKPGGRRSMERVSAPFFRRHYTSQSVGGTSRGSKGLDSIFDLVPTTSLSSSSSFPHRRNEQPLSASLKLNPSAKAFQFGERWPASVRTSATSPSGERVATHKPFESTGSSQSSLNGVSLSISACPATDLHRDSKITPSLQSNQSDSQLGLHLEIGSGDTVHSGGKPEKTRRLPFTSLGTLDVMNASCGINIVDKVQPENVISRARGVLSDRSNSGPKTSPNENNPGLRKAEVPNSLHTGNLLSPGEALPSACTKMACAGLFGPIGGEACKAVSAVANRTQEQCQSPEGPLWPISNPQYQAEAGVF